MARNQVKIITHPAHLGASGNDSIIESALRLIGVAFGDADDWCEKYGVTFENDVFMMHRYCWCERDDCPWCAGCGAFEQTCRACSKHGTHAADCYSTLADDGRLDTYRPQIDAAITERGRHNWGSPKEAAAQKEVNRLCDLESKHRDDVLRALCKEKGIPWNGGRGSAVHCSCGADKRRAAAIKVDGCDYHKGTGIFSRFAPYQHLGDRHYYDPPNFWFKPTDFRLTWYKYIGRDMASNKDVLPGDFLHQIFATHPTGMTVEQAISELERRTEETQETFKAILNSVNLPR